MVKILRGDQWPTKWNYAALSTFTYFNSFITKKKDYKWTKNLTVGHRFCFLSCFLNVFLRFPCKSTNFLTLEWHILQGQMWWHKAIAPHTPAAEEKISVPKNSRSVGYIEWCMRTQKIKLIIVTVIIKYLPNLDIYDLNSITVNNSEQAKRALSASHAWHPRKGSFPVWPSSGEAGHLLCMVRNHFFLEKLPYAFPENVMLRGKDTSDSNIS